MTTLTEIVPDPVPVPGETSQELGIDNGDPTKSGCDRALRVADDAATIAPVTADAYAQIDNSDSKNNEKKKIAQR